MLGNGSGDHEDAESEGCLHVEGVRHACLVADKVAWTQLGFSVVLGHHAPAFGQETDLEVALLVVGDQVSGAMSILWMRGDVSDRDSTMARGGDAAEEALRCGRRDVES